MEAEKAQLIGQLWGLGLTAIFLLIFMFLVRREFTPKKCEGDKTAKEN